MKFLRQKVYALVFWRTPCGEVLSKAYDTYYYLKFYFNNKLPDRANLEFYLIKRNKLLFI